MNKRLALTADDFGRDLSVNEAVETAHRHGVLTGASLMVTAPALGDAVERARRLPGLRVGLHLALVGAAPALPPTEIPALVGPDGTFRSNLVRTGVAYCLGRSTREQLRREIEAQFAAFAATGLALDHVNAHRHLHVHPVVCDLLIEIGKRHGMRAVRIPDEPEGPLRRAEPETPLPRPLERRVMRPFVRRLRRRLRSAGVEGSDRVFGIAWSGKMIERRVLALVSGLEPGTSEIYCHPRAVDDAPGQGHGSAAELAALTGTRLREEIERAGIELTSFGRLADPAGRA